MANTNTAIAPTPQFFPLTGLPDVTQNKTSLPKAECYFIGVSEAITASGAGDTQSLSVTCSLPQNFAYTLLDISFRVWGIDSSKPFETCGFAGFTDLRPSLGQVLALAHMCEGTSHNTGTTQEQVYAFNNRPTAVAIADSGPSSFEIYLGNTNTQVQASNAEFLIRFGVYNIDQAHHVQVNAPQLTRSA